MGVVVIILQVKNLESFFGKQRSHGGRCDNPTVKDFVYNTTSIRLQGALAKDPLRVFVDGETLNRQI